MSTLLVPDCLRCYDYYSWVLDVGICTSNQSPRSRNVLSFKDSAIELIDATIFSMKIWRTE